MFNELTTHILIVKCNYYVSKMIYNIRPDYILARNI